MLIDYIRQVHASMNFKLSDKFEFMDFDDITPDMVDSGTKVPDHIEIWAAVKVFFEGDPPDSYKILNLTIGDWVASHENELTKVIHQELHNHFKKTYPNSDTSDINEDSDSAIWVDQLDYMPRMNEKDKHMIIEIELVLESDIVEE